MPTSRFTRRCALALAAVLTCSLAAAQDGWPARAITLVNPYAAGGPADNLARTLARQLESRLKTPVIVENKAGGGATIGTGAVARAKPDGHTLLISTSAGHVVTPLMQKIPYDGVADFDFIGVVANQPNVLVANPALKAGSVAELLALAKKEPGALNYASAGTGGATHLGGVMLQQRAGIQLTHVPYAGAAPALKEVLGGQVQLGMLNLAAVLPFVKEGRLKALAYSSRQRSELLPEVPTLAEAGIANAESSTWYTLSAPRGTPAPVLQKLAQALDATLADESFRQFLLSQGSERMVLSPAATTAFVREDRRQMAQLLGAMGSLAK
ncbi:Bug family tripartite tricarboxylate transporter substrate binding protein [Comamonas endophytica]|uniref:Tripartite tricarboxylate transporter substrate binding protein n=1 Tax=Comamonas endophytica TaxID=2949090 RepID=A0ABY6GEY4_9BURK|nr:MULTISPECIES: tripartite tricarboxylate transporter substrate binding protein [unclassified Acidovorax]MCD2514310.1 tripartite tricarboxylate transporter substrate binding protein [Acidovorax sp. D4N7]UYG53559.1 tripartite tricarboxylate transporter substrate binding protein [Acidovorax sp. 5MLIR]